MCFALTVSFNPQRSWPFSILTRHFSQKSKQLVKSLLSAGDGWKLRIANNPRGELGVRKHPSFVLSLHNYIQYTDAQPAQRKQHEGQYEQEQPTAANHPDGEYSRKQSVARSRKPIDRGGGTSGQQLWQ